MTPAELASEINTDPTARGYAAPVAAGNHVAVADLLNARQAGIMVQRTSIETSEIISATVPAEYGSATAAQRAWFDRIITVERVYLTATIRAFFGTMFGAATVTRANILALIDRQGSRAEQLWGEGATVSHLDISRALEA